MRDQSESAYVHVCACMCVLDGKGSWMFASRVMVLVETAMYLTGCIQ